MKELPCDLFHFNGTVAEARAVAGAECNTVIELKPEHHAA